MSALGILFVVILFTNNDSDNDFAFMHLFFTMGMTGFSVEVFTLVFIFWRDEDEESHIEKYMKVLFGTISVIGSMLLGAMYWIRNDLKLTSLGTAAYCCNLWVLFFWISFSIQRRKLFEQNGTDYRGELMANLINK